MLTITTDEAKRKQKEDKQKKKLEQKLEQKQKDEALAKKNNQGIFGFGLSEKNYLELLTIVFLACAGIIIKLCFSENFSDSGNMGPASSTIWGYGLTAIALSIMAFMGIYISNKIFDNANTNANGNSNSNLSSFLKIMLNILPIVLTLFTIIYIIYLNFSFFTRINSNKVTREYYTYSYISSFLLIIQIILISMYLFRSINKSQEPGETIKIELMKSATYVLSAINFIFLFMIHINLAVFSTDDKAD